MGDHLLTLEALCMKTMRLLPALLQSSAVQGVRQWHKQTTCWFTCGSHRLPQIHPIEIQITKTSGRSLILYTKEDARLNTKPSPKTAAEMPTCLEPAARAAEDIQWKSVWVGWGSNNQSRWMLQCNSYNNHRLNPSILCFTGGNKDRMHHNE